MSFLRRQESKSIFWRSKMLKIFRIVGIVLSCCVLNTHGQNAVNSTTETNTSPQNQKTKIVIVGGIHQAHHKNSKYSCEVLKEIILSLKPDVILNELPLSQIDPDGRPIERLRDKQISPECWAADTAATQLGIKQIPFDRCDREENFKKTSYVQRRKRWGRFIKKWAKQLEKEDPNSLNIKIAQLLDWSAEAEAHLLKSSCPEVINSESHDSVIRIKHSLRYDIVPMILKQYPGFKTLIDDCHFFKDQWHERNRIMADNIIKVAKEYPDKRLVIVSGATHRYILRDLLKDEKSIELKEYWEIKGLTTRNAEIMEKKQK